MVPSLDFLSLGPHSSSCLVGALESEAPVAATAQRDERTASRIAEQKND